MKDKFTIEIHSGDALVASPEGQMTDGEFDDVNGLLGEICEVLRLQGVSFVVSGFGQDWPVDVDTDLLVVLEQINDCLQEIDSGKFNFCLDFYEQGIERRLYFSEFDINTLKVVCESDSNWEPSSPEISVSKEYVALMLNELKLDFVVLARTICPRLSSHALFDAWVGLPNPQ